MTNVRMQRCAAAEELAAQYLLVRGLKVLARNLRCKAGELDLVCLDGGILAVIEVRQRACDEFGGALGSLTWHKRRKIMRATQYFLRGRAHWRGLGVRFDVVAVEGLP